MSNTYMGNSVQYWYSKAKAYGKCVTELWEILGGADGETDIRDAVRKLLQDNTLPSETDRAGHKITRHWLEAAHERIRAGEDEAAVMADYGWTATRPESGNGTGSAIEAESE